MPEQHAVTLNDILALALICMPGFLLLWRWQFSAAARAKFHVRRIGHVGVPWIYFAAMSLFVAITAFLAQVTFMQLCKWFYKDMPLNTGYGQVLASGMFDIGAIAAALYARRFLRVLETLPHIALTTRQLIKPPPPVSIPKALLIGAGVFGISIAILTPVSALWNWLLSRLGVAAGEQDLVQMFRGETDPARIAMLALIAVVIAPIFEEIIFRGALFGYLRTRIPRALAIALPSLLFAAVHFNLRASLPLFVLAVVFSIAYERTGRIAVPIVAHALFNFSTIAAILLGLSKT